MIREYIFISLIFVSSFTHSVFASADSTEIPFPDNRRLEHLISLDRSLVAFSGQGVRVCVIDSGQQLAIAERQNLVIAPYNALDGSSDVTDQDGHGTAAAGIIHQIAPSAVLIPVKAFNNGVGNYFSVAEAIIHCLDHKADVISISANVHSELNIRIPDLVGKRFSKALFVVAAGNSGYEFENGKSIFNNVIVIGATNLDLPLQASSYSVFGSGVDIYAPAGDDKDGIETWTPEGGLRSFNGTSGATPVVAGAMALLKQKYPKMTAAQMKAFLLRKSCGFKTGKTATDVGRYLSVDILLNDVGCVR